MTSNATRHTVAPFYVATGGAPEKGRRFLLVSHAFPPDSSMGALRWQKLVEYAATRGWAADVLMMDPAESHTRDDSRLTTLPAGTRLFGIPMRPHPLMTAERWLRQRLGGAMRRGARAKPAGRLTRTAAPSYTGPISEPGLRGKLHLARRAHLARIHYAEWEDWARRAADAGIALAPDAGYAFVASSGPPHLAHEAARLVGRALRIPFVMDLRDQFFADETQPPSLRSGTWLRLTKRFERRCAQAASLIVMNTKAMEGIMQERYPALRERIISVTNGADPDVQSTRPLKRPFTLIHTGTLYNGRDPRGLLQGLRIAVERLGVSPGQLRCRFMGSDSYQGRTVEEIAESVGVGAFVDAERTRPRAEAIQAQEESALLVILPQYQWECIPGKLFEYVQLSSWVLAITERDSAVDLLLRGTDADVAQPDDVEGIAAIIQRRFEAFERGVRPAPVNADGRFDRSAQGKLLFDACEALLR